jgi:hypothetical protein
MLSDLRLLEACTTSSVQLNLVTTDEAPILLLLAHVDAPLLSLSLIFTDRF